MFMYDVLHIEEGVTLPHFPESIDHTSVEWQTKSLVRALGRYKLSANGRLLRREYTTREKTVEEKNQMAREYTSDAAQTWDEWEELGSDDGLCFPLETWKTTVDDEWWVDHNYHGTIQFYTGDIQRRETGPDVFFEYEAVFNRGNLERLLFTGDRQESDDVDTVIESIETWEER